MAFNQSSFRTAESVSPMHPDKLCDQISDAILDAFLTEDPDARVAVEVCGGHGEIFIVGEVTSKVPISAIDISDIVTRITHDKNLRLNINLVHQSPEIARGVDAGGAGDQGIMIGYACDETIELLPIEVVLARRLNQKIFAKYPFDGKTQISLKYKPQNDNYCNNLNRPSIKVDSIVASFQNVSQQELKNLVEDFIHEYHLIPISSDRNIDLKLNPAGDWTQGGFSADTGLTGRKLIVDNYGPRVPIGGGAFSGKDPSKVDRSAAYMARRIAVDSLRATNAHEVLVRLAYAIGYDQPLERSLIIDHQLGQIKTAVDTNVLSKPSAITKTVSKTTLDAIHDLPLNKVYDLSPRGIISHLKLKRPIYEATARYGHFGEGFIWDQ